MDPIVAAALVTAIPVGLGTVFTYLTARGTKKIVKGNGKGNLTEMMEAMLERQDTHEVKMDRLEDKMDSVVWWQVAHERAHAKAPR